MKPSPAINSRARRLAAEAQQREREAVNVDHAEVDLQRLRHELEVHQIELEMQNDELQTAQAVIAADLERYTDLYDFAPVGYFNLGDDGAIHLVNLTGARFFGVERARLVGQRFGQFVAEPGRGAWSDFLNKVFAADTKQVCELTLAGEGNATRFVLVEATLSPDRKECRAAMLDVSDRRLLEVQLRQAQKMEAVGQLAGGIAHDFNNMLTVIKGRIALLQGDHKFPTEHAEALGEVAEAAERASVLTRQLLTFSRHQVMQQLDLDLNALVHRLATMLRRMLGEDVRMHLACAAAPLWTHADPGQIEQVLLNLAVNARSAMPQGGELHITTSVVKMEEALRVRWPQARPGRFVLLEVRDTGTGIAPEILPRIFEPFFTTKEVGKGTGLGLATVYGTVHQHGGAIEVASTVGWGALFRVYLPEVVPSAASVHPFKPARRVVAGGTETILLVEDEPAVRNLARYILERKGYRVLPAATGVEALGIWREHHQGIRLLFTDIIMPDGMTGQELALRIKKERPDLPIIFTSGYSASIAGKDFPPDKTARFLAKPYGIDELAAVVRESIDAAGVKHPGGAG